MNSAIRKCINDGNHIELSKIIKCLDTSDPLPLYLACQLGHFCCAELLLNKGANIENTYEDHTPLHVAVSFKRHSVMKFLLHRGADPNCITSNGITPLLMASQFGDSVAVQILLHYKVSVDMPTIHGYTPLYYAVQNGFVQIVISLLEARASVDALAPDGSTALYIAAQKGFARIAGILLRANANIYVDYNGYTPLYIACYMGFINIVKDIIIHHNMDMNHFKISPNRLPIYGAVIGGHDSIVELLCDKRANLKQIYEDGNSILHIAALHCEYDCMSVLYRYMGGAQIANAAGLTPADIVMRK